MRASLSNEPGVLITDTLTTSFFPLAFSFLFRKSDGAQKWGLWKGFPYLVFSPPKDHSETIENKPSLVYRRAPVYLAPVTALTRPARRAIQQERTNSSFKSKKKINKSKSQTGGFADRINTARCISCSFASFQYGRGGTAARTQLIISRYPPFFFFFLFSYVPLYTPRSLRARLSLFLCRCNLAAGGSLCSASRPTSAPRRASGVVLFSDYNVQRDTVSRQLACAPYIHAHRYQGRLNALLDSGQHRSTARRMGFEIGRLPSLVFLSFFYFSMAAPLFHFLSF